MKANKVKIDEAVNMVHVQFNRTKEAITLIMLGAALSDQAIKVIEQKFNSSSECLGSLANVINDEFQKLIKQQEVM